MPNGNTPSAGKTGGRYVVAAGRIAMGFLFVVTGLNGFFNFLPPPSAPMPEGAAAFAAALLKTGYMFRMVMATQLVAGALLLSNRFVPLALALIAPVVVNIVAFHVFLAPSGRPIAAVVLVLEVFLAWAYRKAYRSMLAARTTPGGE